MADNCDSGKCEGRGSRNNNVFCVSHLPVFDHDSM